ncbi:hypothetical protein PHYSODRAFT_475936, partial [Phytophthora sojae]
KHDSDELLLIANAGQTGEEFSINVREHLCIALALWSWDPVWCHQTGGKMIHVKCWSDSKAAVAWCSKLHSTKLFSQEINRCIGLAEAFFNLRVSAKHIPGSTNWMADAASRAWTEPHQTRWTKCSSSWTQIPIPRLQSRSLATSSTAKFNSTWEQWTKWCEWLNLPWWLPENPSHHSYQLALFATYCWQYGWNASKVGNTTNTVLSKISHFSWRHRRMLGYGVRLLPAHQLAITGMRRSNPPTSPKSPTDKRVQQRRTTGC